MKKKIIKKHVLRLQDLLGYITQIIKNVVKYIFLNKIFIYSFIVCTIYDFLRNTADISSSKQSLISRSQENYLLREVN